MQRNIHQCTRGTWCKLVIEGLVRLIHKVVNVAPEIFATVKYINIITLIRFRTLYLHAL